MQLIKSIAALILGLGMAHAFKEINDRDRVTNGASFKMAWLSGYAPPPLGDKQYDLTPNEPASHMLGVVFLNPDGTRLALDMHPWVWDDTAQDHESQAFYNHHLKNNEVRVHSIPRSYDLEVPTYPIPQGYPFVSRDYVAHPYPNNKIGYNCEDPMKACECTPDAMKISDCGEQDYEQKWQKVKSWGGKACFNKEKSIVDNDVVDSGRYHMNDNETYSEECVGYEQEGYAPVRNGFTFLNGLRLTESTGSDPRYFRFWFLLGRPAGQLTGSPLMDTYYFHYMGNKALPYITLSSPYYHVGDDSLVPFSIQLTTQTEKIFANAPFNINITIKNKNGLEIDQSKMSSMESMVQVSTTHKNFKPDGTLEASTFNLRGADVLTLENNDKAVFCPSDKATVSIDNAGEVDIAVTMKRSTFNYGLIPLKEIVKVTVLSQKPTTLNIPEILNFTSKQSIFFPINPSVQVELLDENGFRISSGPYSALTVTPIAMVDGKPVDNILSTDASFALHEGLGTFKGSIVKPTEQVSLFFKVTIKHDDGKTEDITTAKGTPKYDADNKQELVGIMFDKSRGNVLESSSVYESDLEAKLGKDNYLSVGDLQGVKTMTDIRTKVEITQPELMVRYVALIGTDDHNTESLATMAAANDLVTVSHASTLDKFRNKMKQPLLTRLGFSDIYRYTMIANFMKSREWLNTIVVTGQGQAIPASLASQLTFFGIDYYSVIFTGNEVDQFFQTIKESDLKIVISLLEGEPLENLADECSNRRFRHQDGFTWVLDKDPLFKDHAKKQARLDAFNGALVFANGVPNPTMRDADDIFRDAFARIQIAKRTITPETLQSFILDAKAMSFDDNHDRTNYEVKLKQIDSSNSANYLIDKRLLKLGKMITPDNITDTNRIEESNGDSSISYATADGRTIKLTIPVSGVATTETIPLPFYCFPGCNASSCTWDNRAVCNCEEGYAGDNCTIPICTDCEEANGDCMSPGVCKCKPGYKDSDSGKNDCGQFHCEEKGCTNGICVGPNICTCKEELYDYKGFYGADCSGKCECSETGSKNCIKGNKGSGVCECKRFYSGPTCSTNTLVVGLVSTFAVLVVLAVAFFAFRWYRNKVMMRNRLMCTDWKVVWDEVRMRQANQKSSVKSMMSMMSMLSAKSGKVDGNFNVQNQGQWNGRDIVVKIIRKDKLDLSMNIRKEIKQVREMQHPNLCLFIGACLDAPHICVLNEICGKGSLEDILANDEVSLGWDFRYSMLKDICRGMAYIGKSEIGSHGRLKSSNCLVDNKWCVKISDFGLSNFKDNQFGVRIFSPSEGIGLELPEDKDMEGCDFHNLLWTAPEILRIGVSHINHVGYGNLQADVFSLSIIMVEMCTRQHPYYELAHLRPDEVVHMIGQRIELDGNIKLVECTHVDGQAVQVVRPQVNEEDLPDEGGQAEGLMTLIETCWNEDPKARPDFNTVGKCLNKISPHQGELMDNLISLMEQYTNSLEVIVAERTSNIVQEKEKIDVLLGKMLPPLIAEELKSGKNPQPEYFNNVTIYFSDIVGFSALCQEADPFQVVDILNGLYNIMDTIIDQFDCYKVETIGDCYMVASGLPVRNGDRHAGEIASMSLALMQGFNGVSYHGFEGKQVQLRVGMHSGSCVAGVVGIKMPRYCLFGDTVNTASRMESGGYALKIHMSNDTYQVLERLGGYEVECRGEIAVKGRGTMTTYWLTGKTGVQYNLPSQDLALSASQHYFK